MKRCANCKEIKEENEFNKNKRNKDGLHSYCKACNKLKAKQFNQTEKGKENVKKAQKKQFESGYFKYGKGAILNMKKNADKRGIDFSLTEECLMEWWNSEVDYCFYCDHSIEEYLKIKDYIIQYDGTDFEVLRFKRFFQQDIYIKISEMTIDRRDNSKGYSIDNIVKSCWICNSLKSDFYTEEEMMKIGRFLYRNLEKQIWR